jgi:hypothetical protein
MRISYEVTDVDGKVIREITGTQLRKHFGYGPQDDIFTEQLVKKFNLTSECAGNPERIRMVEEIVT